MQGRTGGDRSVLHELVKDNFNEQLSPLVSADIDDHSMDGYDQSTGRNNDVELIVSDPCHTVLLPMLFIAKVTIELLTQFMYITDCYFTTMCDIGSDICKSWRGWPSAEVEVGRRTSSS